ncbi:MAG: GNAT family N-acetyltransferase [Flavobacteriales bacterium]|nr:GNAT family N-acetyltransferase [Flavobacteriales bacterium]
MDRMQAWIEAFPELKPLGDAAEPAGWVWPTRLGGVRAWVTPPWSLDIGSDAQADLVAALMQSSRIPIQIFDLPAGSALAASYNLKNVCAHPRHTRQVKLDDYSPPKKRSQQARRALREGTTIVDSRDVALHVALHQAARKRKGITSDERRLTALITALLAESNHHAWIALNAGRPIASAIIVRDTTTALYALGGQVRSEDPGITARSSVLLLAHAIEQAAQQGDQIFDFGGSSDPGVDRFYAEFGAAVTPKVRLVKTAAWIRPLIALKRPDLVFPKPVPSS